MTWSGMLGITLVAVLPTLHAFAQVSASVTVTPTPDQLFPVGSEVEVQLYVDTGVPVNGNSIDSSSFICVVDGSNVLSTSDPGLSNLGTNYIYSTIFYIPGTYTAAVGTHSVLCTTGGNISGNINGVFGGQGSASFIVSSCTGDSDYTEGDVTDVGGGQNLTPWTLSATMNPANPSPTTASATGNGITGNLATTIYYYDCDGGTNDDIPEQDAQIADSSQTLSGNVMTFNFQISNYNYQANQCDICSTYFDNYENPGVTSPSYTTASLTQSCGSN
jgi:hypothetical protein